MKPHIEVESRWSPHFFFQASSFQLLKLENLLRWSFFTFTPFFVVNLEKKVPFSCRVFSRKAIFSASSCFVNALISRVLTRPQSVVSRYLSLVARELSRAPPALALRYVEDDWDESEAHVMSWKLNISDTYCSNRTSLDNFVSCNPWKFGNNSLAMTGSSRARPYNHLIKEGGNIIILITSESVVFTNVFL